MTGDMHGVFIRLLLVSEHVVTPHIDAEGRPELLLLLRHRLPALRIKASGLMCKVHHDTGPLVAPAELGDSSRCDADFAPSFLLIGRKALRCSRIARIHSAVRNAEVTWEALQEGQNLFAIARKEIFQSLTKINQTFTIEEMT